MQQLDVETATTLCLVETLAKVANSRAQGTIAGIKVRLTEKEIQELIRGDRAVAQLLERMLDKVQEPEIAHHLGAEYHEHSDGRRRWRNGH